MRLIRRSIDRLADAFQKDESSEEIHELEREAYRDDGELAEMSQEEENPVNMDAQLFIKAAKRKSRKKAIPFEVELDLSGKFPMGI